jgi:hypothetical protein
MLNQRGWKQLIFKNVCTAQGKYVVLCNGARSEIKSVDFVVLTKALSTFMST